MSEIVDITPELEQSDGTIKVLVIGKGYVGSNLSTFLSTDNENLEVHNISRDQVDYLDRNTLAGFLYQFSEEGIVFDTIVNAVGYTGDTNIDDAENDKELAFLLNTVFPVTLASVAQEFNVARVINIMSGCIFDGAPETKEGENQRAWLESDVPNFGMFDDDSSYYSKTKHAAELITSSSFSNIMNLRIRMPIGEINHKRNLISKLLNYDTILSEKNSVTYIYDLFNFVYNMVIADEVYPGTYNVVNPGFLDAKELFEVLQERKTDLVNLGLIENENHFDNVKFISLEEFKKSNLTKVGRSNIIMSGEFAAETMGMEFTPINKEFYNTILDNMMIAAREVETSEEESQE